MLRHVDQLISPTRRLRTYRHLVYLSVGGFLGLGYATLPAILLVLGVTPLAAWTCAPILLILSGFSRCLRDLERRLANVMLDTSVPAPATVERAVGGSWRRPKRRILELVEDPVEARAVAWLAFRTIFGLAALSMVTAAVLAVASILYAPFGNGLSDNAWWSTSGPPVLLIILLMGGLLLAMAQYANSLAGFHALLAGHLLGPSSAERLAVLKRSYGKIVERNRIAGELHDSVGHDLSLVVMQADAAYEVFDTNPEFARQALATIKEIAREALGGVDRMVGVLEDEPGRRDEGRDLRDLAGLLERMRSLRLPVSASVSGDPTSVPGRLGEETYRIVREGCTNVLKHAGRVPTRVSVAVDQDSLEVAVLNESPETAPAAVGSSVGRRGLRGIAERVDALGGRFEAGPRSEGGYLLRVRLPLQAAQG